MKERSFKSKLANYLAFIIVFFGVPIMAWYILVSILKFLYQLIT